MDKLFLNELKDIILKDKPSKTKISKIKLKLSKKYKLKKIPSDIELLISYNQKDYNLLKSYLSTKPTRNLSGVSVIAIMTKPHNCPHGKCIMCPGGKNSHFGDVPQSYTGNEPATMRAIRNNYDPYLQIFNRLEQYILLGIYPQKIELIIMGGTFLSLTTKYKNDFITNVYKALNDFSNLFFTDTIFQLDKFKKFFMFPKQIDDDKRALKIKYKITQLKKQSTLAKEKKRNEKSNVKCVGLTIETNATYGKLKQGLELLKYGCTRVELGVQTLEDKSLKIMNRGHTVKDIINSIRELKDLGFKLNYHIMLGCPGVANELSILKKFFTNQDYRPDMIKIYPLMVMPGTELEKMYNLGLYKPINTKEASKIIAEFKKTIPSYCRIMRVQRDIPPKHSIAGVDRSNLRQYVDIELKKNNITCNCIRCREIGHVKKEKGKIIIKIKKFKASNGTEFFISSEDRNHTLYGFVRLRFPSKSLIKEITNNSAIIRELHVYGSTVKIGESGKLHQSQHRGLGKELMKKAENLAKKNKKNKIIVISGVGVREYYRKLGYKLESSYMVKEI